MPTEEKKAGTDAPTQAVAGRAKPGQAGDVKSKRRSGSITTVNNKSWCAVCGGRFVPGSQMIRCRTCRRWVHGEAEAKTEESPQVCSSLDQLYCLACQENGWAKWEEEGDSRARRCGNRIWCHHGLALAPSQYCSEECGIQAAELCLEEEEEEEARRRAQEKSPSASPSTVNMEDTDIIRALTKEEDQVWRRLEEEEEELERQRRELNSRIDILATSSTSIPSGQCGFPSALIHPFGEDESMDIPDPKVCQATPSRCILHRRWPLVWEELLRKQQADLEREESMVQKEKAHVLLGARRRIDRAALLVKHPQAFVMAGQTIPASPNPSSC